MSGASFECVGCRAKVSILRRVNPKPWPGEILDVCEYCAPWILIYGADGRLCGYSQPLTDPRALALVRALHRLEARVDSIVESIEAGAQNMTAPATSPAVNERPEGIQ